MFFLKARSQVTSKVSSYIPSWRSYVANLIPQDIYSLHKIPQKNVMKPRLLLLLLLLFVLGLQAVRHARTMRRCGLEKICSSNPVPTSDSGQSSPRLWVPNPYSLSLTRRSNMHFNDKGQMNGYIGNDNREWNEWRTETGGTNITYGDSQLPRLWHYGPSSSVPEYPKRPLPSSMRIRYCVWAWTFAIFPSESSQAFETVVLILNQWPRA